MLTLAQVDAESATVLAQAVRQSRSLTALDLTNNPVRKEGAAALAAALKPANLVPLDLTLFPKLNPKPKPQALPLTSRWVGGGHEGS